MTPEETVLIRWIERTMRGEVGAFDALASNVKMCEECGVKSPLIDATRRYVVAVQLLQRNVPCSNSLWLVDCIHLIDDARLAMHAALNAAKEAAK